MCAALALRAPCEVKAVAQTQYKFINIATESRSLDLRFGSAFSMNSIGVVAFRAIGENGHSIFTGNGGPLTTVVDSGGPFSVVAGSTAINDSGTVAFIGHRAGPEEIRGLYTTTGGGSVVTIAEGSFGQPYSVVGRQSINADGTVAFVAAPAGLDYGIYKGNGGPLTAIASREALSGVPRETSINSNGVVAFLNGRELIVTGSGGVLTPVVGTEGAFGRLRSPSINSSGSIAFAAALDAGGDGVYVHSGGSTQTIADTSGAFTRIDSLHLSINDFGEVAFIAGLDSSARSGIYTGPDSLADRVIGPGDPLFGSALWDVYGNVVINNRGDIAFDYGLVNGLRGIAVARVVPEPRGVVLLATGLAVVGAIRRRGAECLTPLG